jgi:hypothetical protein
LSWFNQPDKQISGNTKSNSCHSSAQLIFVITTFNGNPLDKGLDYIAADNAVYDKRVWKVWCSSGDFGVIFADLTAILLRGIIES